MRRFAKHFAVAGGIALGVGFCLAGIGVVLFLGGPSGDVDGGDARPIEAGEVAIRWFVGGCITMIVGCCSGALAKHIGGDAHDNAA